MELDDVTCFVQMYRVLITCCTSTVEVVMHMARGLEPTLVFCQSTARAHVNHAVEDIVHIQQ